MAGITCTVIGKGLGPLPYTIENPVTLGINIDRLADAAQLDGAISEFSRFYLERRAQEMQAAGGDERKKKKLGDEFTPRLEMTLVALDGKLYRQLKMKAQYSFDTEFEYSNILSVIPHSGKLVDAPEFGLCARSERTVPKTCLTQCQITGDRVLQHLLVRSEISARLALPEHTVLCSLSGKRILTDEAEISAVSGRMVASAFLKTSSVSGKRQSLIILVSANLLRRMFLLPNLPLVRCLVSDISRVSSCARRSLEKWGTSQNS